MKSVLAIALLLGCICPVSGQEQERKLAERILRPNMEMKSSEQNKAFTANRTGASKQANVKTFYSPEKTKAKQFHQTREFASSKSYHSWANNAANRPADMGRVIAKPTYRTSEADTSIRAMEANKQQQTQDYDGNRPFLAKGKSQKSLDRQNPPMTIDQVRELLNKNR